MVPDDDTLSFAHGQRRLGRLVDSEVATEPGEVTNVDDRGSTRAMGSRSGSASKPPSLSGYEVGELLGRGGMGEVLVGKDRRIGREVAIKRLRGAAPNADMQARFMREARIQARLDHPAIVPVYELGYDSDGQAYFTMKRLSGITLQELLGSEAPPSRPRLLRAFVDICHAVEFAHSRGIVHRDLKPSNIVLGKYNEVYVLDWGLARLVGEDEHKPLLTPGDIDSLDGLTQAGALLGTPGYMAPEQARGEAEIERPADIYALGSILFEILAGESLHPKGDRAIATTIENLTSSAMGRRADRQIAPELDAICAAALATEPEERPSARDLAEKIERFIDGDRDVERRRQLANEHLDAARRALMTSNHVIALRSAGRALALDPESREAADVVTGLMFEPPPEMPIELRETLDGEDLAFGRKMGFTAAVTFAFCFAFLPFAFLIDVTSWPIIAGVFALFAALGIHSAISFRREVRPMTGALFGMAVLIVLLSRLFSPLVFVPGLVLAATFGLTTYPKLIDRPKLVAGVLGFAVALPMVLEFTGVWTSTWELKDGALRITSAAANLDGTAAKALLLMSNLGMIVVGGWFARSIALARRNAQRRLAIQAWHLRQLLPQ